MKEHKLDYRNLYCPEPIILLNKKIQEISAQETIRILATDPAFHEEITAWCQQKGHHLIKLRKSFEIEAIILTN